MRVPANPYRRRCASLIGVVALGLSGLCGTLQAELGSDEYLSGTVIQSKAEREQARARIEAARQRESERAEARVRAEAAERLRQAQLAEEADRRPLGARLTETHCGTCHALDQLGRVRHTELGWALTIARMRYLNDARIPAEDAAHIRRHLARTQPAETAQAWLEYGLVSLLTLLTLGWALWHWAGRCGTGLCDGS
ncbi:MAG: hypothetical protein MZV65_22170 [Chromatiales bacterium]|nr:hypothetical protein [Chromatiales bacterium]